MLHQIQRNALVGPRPAPPKCLDCTSLVCILSYDCRSGGGISAQRSTSDCNYVPKWSQSSQSRAKERQGLQKDADPQQSSQPRPEERRPAVAGENMPDSLEPWRGRRGRRSDGQPMSSGTWPGGTWSDAGATNALGWGKYKAAVAASEPMKVASSMGTSRVWSD